MTSKEEEDQVTVTFSHKGMDVSRMRLDTKVAAELGLCLTLLANYAGEKPE